MDEQGFFSEHYDALSRFKDLLEAYVPAGDQDKEAAQLLRAATDTISFHREEYDSYAPYSVKNQGKALLDAMRSPLNPSKVQRALFCMAVFIREASLARDSRSSGEQAVLDHFLGADLPAPDADWNTYEFDYLRYVLPRRLLDAQHRGIARLKDEFEKLQKDSVTKADELEQRISGYRGELKKLASDYNFVGLSHAFKALVTDKISEKRLQFAFMLVLAAVAIAVPIQYMLNADDSLVAQVIAGWAPTAIGKLAAAVGLEIIILYFFRVSLRTYLLTRAQITNLQLRLSLCAFIEGYLEFARTSRDAQESGALSGFESLIFGPLPAEGPALPATLDGLEQLVGLVNAARKPG